MTKSSVFATGAILGIVVAALVIMRERSEIARLREAVASLQAEREQLPRLPTVGRPNLIGQNGTPTVLPQEPSLETLQLRAEVSRLRSDLESLRLQNHDLIQQLASSHPSPTDFRNEGYRVMGIETNTLPKIDVGATTNEVIAELQRVGAKLLTDQEKHLGPDRYLQAEVSPALLAEGHGEFVTIRMEFYFDEGRLTSRRDWPRWEKISNR